MTRSTLICLSVVFTFYLVAAQAQFHDPRALEADPESARQPIAPRLSGLGENHFAVTAGDPASQYFFDQGLRLTYGFNHSEALRSFKESARLDPDNAMAWWGQALVLGPNINLPMMPYVTEQAWVGAQAAVTRRDGVSEKERDLIDALATRYAENPDADRAPLDAAYAEAMTALADKYPDDPDIATLTASAVMNLSPWNYWYRDGTPYEPTLMIISMLERSIEAHPTHTGALHYYIHIIESQLPGRGEPAADLLSGLTPGAGHLLHMPSHIYMRVGRYAESYAVNVAASQADRDYIAECRAQGLYPVDYYPHNVHFLVWSAQYLGRYEDAMTAALQIRDKIPAFVGVAEQTPSDVKSDAWKIYETFLSQPLYTMVRFGDWQAVLAQPRPAERARFMNGVWHYARGLALAHTDDIDAAIQEAVALEAILSEPGIDEYPVSLNGAGALLEIAAALLAGEIAAASGDYAVAINRLERAVRLQDGILYMEPPDWFFPSRHYLGAALLDAGLAGEAETVYWADLRRNPKNGFALFGLQQAQQAQGKSEAAEATQDRFLAAWEAADHELTSSRF